MPTLKPDLVSKLEIYKISPDITLSVTVLVGDGQAGGTVLHWKGGTTTIPGEDRDPKVVGDGRALAGTFLDVTTTVEDIREETNQTSLTIRLAGGTEDREFHYAYEVDEDGVVIYAIKILLTS